MKIENFKKELRELLNKYNACIYFTCSEFSDTYGIYEEGIELSIMDIDGFEEEKIKIDGWGLCSSDLN